MQQFPVLTMKITVLQCALLLPRLGWTSNEQATILVTTNLRNLVLLLIIARILLSIFLLYISCSNWRLLKYYQIPPL